MRIVAGAAALLLSGCTMFAPAPEPAPGQGVPPGAVGLRAWVEFIGAVAVEAQEAAQP